MCRTGGLIFVEFFNARMLDKYGDAIDAGKLLVVMQLLTQNTVIISDGGGLGVEKLLTLKTPLCKNCLLECSILRLRATLYSLLTCKEQTDPMTFIEINVLHAYLLQVLASTTGILISRAGGVLTMADGVERYVVVAGAGAKKYLQESITALPLWLDYYERARELKLFPLLDKVGYIHKHLMLAECALSNYLRFLFRSGWYKPMLPLGEQEQYEQYVLLQKERLEKHVQEINRLYTADFRKEIEKHPDLRMLNEFVKQFFISYKGLNSGLDKGAVFSYYTCLWDIYGKGSKLPLIVPEVDVALLCKTIKQEKKMKES